MFLSVFQYMIWVETIWKIYIQWPHLDQNSLTVKRLYLHYYGNFYYSRYWYTVSRDISRCEAMQAWNIDNKAVL